MLDIAKTRDEIKKLHDEASAHVDKYSADNAPEASADDVKVQEERFSKMEKLSKQIDEANRLAKFAYTKEQPVAATVIMPSKSKDQLITEAAAVGVAATYEQCAAELSAWLENPDDQYAVVTTTSASALVPKIVSAPITPTLPNVYRRALALVGRGAITLGTTAPNVQPVITIAAGGPFNEGDAQSEITPAMPVITLTPKGYQSGTAWFSGLFDGAVPFNITTTVLPQLESGRDYGFAKGITAKIKADNTNTVSVTTNSASTIVLDNLDSLQQAVGTLFYANRVTVLSTTTYNAFEKLKDSAGLPIMSHSDIQGQKFLSYKGVPVIKDDTLDAMGTSGNMVGVCIGLDGFYMRDEREKLIRYDNSETHIDSVGINNIAYQDAGWAAGAIAKMVN